MEVKRIEFRPVLVKSPELWSSVLSNKESLGTWFYKQDLEMND